MTNKREGLLWFLITALWLFILTYPLALILRAMYCPQQPITQPCSITIQQ